MTFSLKYYIIYKMQKLATWFKKYFIPHEHNEFKPHLLRHESALMLLLLVLLVELVFLAQVFIVFDKTNFLASVLPGVLTTLTNKERAQNNVEPLVQNDLLTKAAQLKANDMAQNEYFAHTSPEGKTPWHWLNQVGYKYSLAGENLAINFFESREVAEAWMNSPTHRANIVKQHYKEIGIAVASGRYQGSDTVFVAQFFGTPTVVAPLPETPAQTEVQTPTPITTTKPKPTPPVTPKPTVVPTKKSITADGGTPQKAVVPEPTPAPTTTIAVVPTTTQVLGEETNATTESIFTQIISDLKSFTDRVLTSPDKFVAYTYGAIAFVVILALMLAMFIKSEMGHRPNVVRGLSIVSVIVILIIVNMRIFHVETKVPSESLEASVIASQ